MKIKRLLAPCCLIAALAAAPANAATIVDTSSPTAPTIGGSGSYSGYDMNSSEAGVVFTTGPGTSYTIQSVSVFLRSQNTTPIISADVVVRLYQSPTGIPNAFAFSNPVATKAETGLSLPGSGSVGSPASITPQVINTGGGASWTLAANTQYFLALSTSTNGVSWVKAAANTASVGSGITYNGWGGTSYSNPFFFAATGGNAAPWIIVSDTSSGGGSSSVPDAGPGPALALLLGGLGLRQWRRTRPTGAAA